jgi:hypothetical protein
VQPALGLSAEAQSERRVVAVIASCAVGFLLVFWAARALLSRDGAAITVRAAFSTSDDSWLAASAEAVSLGA